MPPGPGRWASDDDPLTLVLTVCAAARVVPCQNEIAAFLSGHNVASSTASQPGAVQADGAADAMQVDGEEPAS